MTDRQKAYVLGFVTGYKEELVRTLSYEIGVPSFCTLQDSNDYEAGRLNGEFEGKNAANEMVYEDEEAYFAGTFGDDFKQSIRESLVNDGPIVPGPGYMQPPGFPLYLDTQLTDLCEELKNVLSHIILTSRMGSGVVSTDVLDNLYDQVDDIEQKVVMEQVDDYYGR